MEGNNMNPTIPTYTLDEKVFLERVIARAVEVAANKIKKESLEVSMYAIETAQLDIGHFKQTEVLTMHGQITFHLADFIHATLVEIFGAGEIPALTDWYKMCGLTKTTIVSPT